MGNAAGKKAPLEEAGPRAPAGRKDGPQAHHRHHRRLSVFVPGGSELMPTQANAKWSLEPGKQHSLKLSQRGVTIRMLREIVKLATEQEPGITTRRFVAHYVRPLTAKAQGSGFMEALYQAELCFEGFPGAGAWAAALGPHIPLPDIQPKEGSAAGGADSGKEEARLYFVAHAWDGELRVLAQLLEDHMLAVRQDHPELQGHNIRYWLDALALNQHYEGPPDERPEGAVERVIIHRAHSVLLPLHPWHQPLALARLWVHYEAVTCLLGDKPIEPLWDPALLEKALAAKRGNLAPEATWKEHYAARLQLVLDGIDIEKARATHAHDRDVIMRRLEQHVGLEACNRKIKASLTEHVGLMLLVAAMCLGITAEVERLGRMKIPRRYAPLVVSGLVRAVQLDHRDVVRFMIQRGVDPTQASKHLRTSALGAAVSSCNWELARELISMGADPSLPASPDGSTLLHAACHAYEEVTQNPYLVTEASRRDQVRLLTSFLSDLLFPGSPLSSIVNAQTQPRGTTPLLLASQFLAPHLVELLLKHGADPKATDYKHRGCSDLAFAALSQAVPMFDDWDADDHWEEDPFVDEELTIAQLTKRRFDQVMVLLKKADAPPRRK